MAMFVVYCVAQRAVVVKEDNLEPLGLCIF